jgi:hypothetical protein
MDLILIQLGFSIDIASKEDWTVELPGCQLFIKLHAPSFYKPPGYPFSSSPPPRSQPCPRATTKTAHAPRYRSFAPLSLSVCVYVCVIATCVCSVSTDVYSMCTYNPPYTPTHTHTQGLIRTPSDDLQDPSEKKADSEKKKFHENLKQNKLAEKPGGCSVQ